MRLYAYQSNQRFRDIRKKQFNLHSQQKLVFRELIRQNPNPNFKQPDFYRTIVNGVPSEFRTQVWTNLISNPYNITHLFYSSILAHLANHQKILEVHQQKQNYQERVSVQRSSIATIAADGVNTIEETGVNSEERPNKMVVMLTSIGKDLPRTFPELKSLHQDPEDYKKLTRILGAISIARQDIGYIQGMSHIAALFLLELNDEFQSFLAMMTVLSTTLLNDFFTFKQQVIYGFSNRVEERLKKMSPQVWDLLIAHEIDFKMLAVNWVMTMFTRCFQLDSILNVWDILLVNKLSEGIMTELCVAVLVARKNAMFECGDTSKLMKTLIHGKLDLAEEEWVLEYMRGLARI